MFNKVILIGNLTKDPEVRYTPGGTPVATLRVAVTTKYKQGEEHKDETLFIDAVVFGRQAEVCGQYLVKGSPALVEGRLRERHWESEGVQKSKMEILANNVRLFPKGERRRDDGAGITAPAEEVTDLEPF